MGAIKMGTKAEVGDGEHDRIIKVETVLVLVLELIHLL